MTDKPEVQEWIKAAVQQIHSETEWSSCDGHCETRKGELEQIIAAHAPRRSEAQPDALDEYLTDPLALAVLFHATYERLAPNSGYETRKETRIFDPESANGKLMLATCAAVQKVLTESGEAPQPTQD